MPSYSGQLEAATSLKMLTLNLMSKLHRGDSALSKRLAGLWMPSLLLGT